MINSISELGNITWQPTGKLIKDMTQKELLKVLLIEINNNEELKNDYLTGEKILRSFQYGKGM